MLIRLKVFTLLFIVILVGCNSIKENGKMSPSLSENQAKVLFEGGCSKAELYRNNVAYIIRFTIEGKIIADDDEKFSPNSAINRLGENLKELGYEISATAKTLQIPQNGKMVFFSQWEGNKLEAQKRFLQATLETIDNGGIDYLAFGEVNLYPLPYDNQIGVHLAAGTTNISLLNVTTGEELGVTNKEIRGQGVDITQAFKQAMARSLEASVQTLVKYVKAPPKNCLSKGKQLLLSFVDYSNERKQVTPFRNELLKKGVQFIRCREREDENTDEIYTKVCAVRFEQKGLGLNNLVNQIIDKYGLDNAIKDVKLNGYDLKIIYQQPEED